MRLSLLFYVAFLLALAPIIGRPQAHTFLALVARVNNTAITRAEYESALADLKVQIEHQLIGHARYEIESEFERQKDSMLGTMIDNLLLEQKARSSGYEQIAIFEGREGERAFEGEGIDPDTFEEILRRQGIGPAAVDAARTRRWLREYLIHREVVLPLYQSISDKDRIDYYETHQGEFTTTARVELSEICVPFEGSGSDPESLTDEVIRELRDGLPFRQAVIKYGDATRPSYARKGRLGRVAVNDLKREIQQAISGRAPGEILGHFKLNDSYEIIRLDAFFPPQLRSLNDRTVIEAITRSLIVQRLPGALANYMAELRKRALIYVYEAETVPF